ncbi:cell wall anchor protein [Myxococcus landrumensis]|uniref:Cell wall anchor protein n=1 Tax=Myxococcus landrumensis TaxID=2813577 RepID=A0ABX7NJ50_9BACT|nr:cell wall anchor protein [Myxococcus landrumus]
MDALNGGLTSGNPETRRQALSDVAEGGKAATEALKAGLETRRDIQKYGSAYRAASKSLAADAPNLKGTARASISLNIAKTAFNHVDAGDMAPDAADTKFDALKKDTRAFVNETTAKAHGAGSNEVKRLLNNGTGKTLKSADDALKAGIHAGAKAAGSGLAKGVGRFVPGANVAIAAFDTAKFASTLTDPEANAGEQITAGITAAGSILAATNIPLVSQAGAAISTVSDFVGSFF